MTEEILAEGRSVGTVQANTPRLPGPYTAVGGIRGLLIVHVRSRRVGRGVRGSRLRLKNHLYETGGLSDH